MRAMLAGILAAGACLIVVGNAEAQQSCAASAAVPGLVSQPVYSSGVPAQPLVIGEIVGEPVIAGGNCRPADRGGGACRRVAVEPRRIDQCSGSLSHAGGHNLLGPG